MTRTPDRFDGLINVTYRIPIEEAVKFLDLINAKENHGVYAPTRVVVTVFSDGEISIDFHGRILTKDGRINQAVGERNLYVPTRDEVAVAAAMGIDPTAIPAIRALTQPQPEDDE